MPMPKLDKPIHPRSKAWCHDCSWTAYGIWAHKKASEHFEEFQSEEKGEHIVYVTEPDKDADGNEKAVEE